jgi:hypothetical protein
VQKLAMGMLALAACSGSNGDGREASNDGGGVSDSTPTVTSDAALDGANDAAIEAEAWSTSEAGASSCAASALCDDFEHDVPGTAPAGWTVSMGCNPNTVDAPTDGGGLLVGVDDSRHHSGNNSVRVVGGDSCGYYIVETNAFGSLGADVYARFWVMFSGSPTANHNGFSSMATSGGDHLRLGFQDQVVAWNAQKSDATLPDMDPQGTSTSVATSPGTWQCIEIHVAEASGHLEFWLDGQSVAGLGYDGGDAQGVDDQWSRGAPSPLVPTSLALGWLGLNDQQTVWFDDVALGDSRIGCD